jgi:hypothetical protein
VGHENGRIAFSHFELADIVVPKNDNLVRRRKSSPRREVGAAIRDGDTPALDLCYLNERLYVVSCPEDEKPLSRRDKFREHICGPPCGNGSHLLGSARTPNLLRKWEKFLVTSVAEAVEASSLADIRARNDCGDSQGGTFGVALVQGFESRQRARTALEE